MTHPHAVVVAGGLTRVHALVSHKGDDEASGFLDLGSASDTDSAGQCGQEESIGLTFVPPLPGEDFWHTLFNACGFGF